MCCTAHLVIQHNFIVDFLGDVLWPAVCVSMEAQAVAMDLMATVVYPAIRRGPSRDELALLGGGSGKNGGDASTGRSRSGSAESKRLDEEPDDSAVVGAPGGLKVVTDSVSLALAGVVVPDSLRRWDKVCSAVSPYCSVLLFTRSCRRGDACGKAPSLPVFVTRCASKATSLPVVVTRRQCVASSSSSPVARSC